MAALIRRIEGAGGGAMVLGRGDATAGALLLVLAERGRVTGARERLLDMAGAYRWSPAGPEEPAKLDEWLSRRRRSDPDLWVVELDHAEAERIANEVLG